MLCHKNIFISNEKIPKDVLFTSFLEFCPLFRTNIQFLQCGSVEKQQIVINVQTKRIRDLARKNTLYWIEIKNVFERF